ncbi:MAG: hypothetical protein KAX44_05030 [Candidatus Brocadiae bacterium]|nr:hypothetical protein [Candidatus Brocadiia bacterium]
MENLVFQNHPTFELGTNTFVNVPIILQYENLPLIEVLQTHDVGFTTQIPIYHPDGTYLAKAVGSRLFLTEDGKRAGLILEHPARATVCKLGEKTLFEIHRTDAAALRTQAELYTPDGRFVKCSQSRTPELYKADGSALTIRGGSVLSGCTFDRCRIGIWVKRNGSVALGCA